jgi:hypothetical protein
VRGNTGPHFTLKWEYQRSHAANEQSTFLTRLTRRGISWDAIYVTVTMPVTGQIFQESGNSSILGFVETDMNQYGSLRNHENVHSKSPYIVVCSTI